MGEYELRSPTDLDPLEWVEQKARALGLDSVLGSLKKYPGSTHWHLTKPGCKGTLEITWWPARNRLWIHQRLNRSADWQDEAIRRFAGG